MAELWQMRISHAPEDFPIGPGDEIDVTVPELDELQNQKVRISADGMLGLPLVGSFSVAGMSENQLREELIKRLHVYMKHPRVELFVQTYHSRGIEIVGAVAKPGVYDLSAYNRSVMDMIGEAGGITAQAAQRVIFVPAEATRSVVPRVAKASATIADDNAGTPHSAMGDADVTSRSSAQVAVGTPPIDSQTEREMRGRLSIELDLSRPEEGVCLDIPARPGDLAIVPMAGQVMVQGWVASPGAYAITPGMTVLGVVAAAGGPVFTYWARLLRTDPSGVRSSTELNLRDIANGRESDVPVMAGDVIILERNAVGAVPYALYSLFNKFGAGMGMGVPVP